MNFILLKNDFHIPLTEKEYETVIRDLTSKTAFERPLQILVEGGLVFTKDILCVVHNYGTEWS